MNTTPQPSAFAPYREPRRADSPRDPRRSELHPREPSLDDSTWHPRRPELHPHEPCPADSLRDARRSKLHPREPRLDDGTCHPHRSELHSHEPRLADSHRDARRFERHPHEARLADGICDSRRSEQHPREPHFDDSHCDLHCRELHPREPSIADGICDPRRCERHPREPHFGDSRCDLHCRELHPREPSLDDGTCDPRRCERHPHEPRIRNAARPEWSRRALRSARGARSVALLLASLALQLPAAGCTKRARPAASAADVSAEPTETPERGMCFAPRHPGLAKQPVRAHDWLSLMTRLELGRGGVFATRDCLGRWINYAPLSNACGTAAYAQMQPRRMAVAEETVLVRDLGDASYLVWVMTHRFEDGDGYGPLALARREADGLSVQAMGVLRLHSERVKLERWTFGEETVVVASGESCQQTSGPRRCERTTQLMLQHGQQLMAAPVVDPQNRCLEQAQFQLARTQERPLGGGVVRSFEMSADITHDARYVVVEERLIVRDADTRSQTQAPRVVQRVETKRLLQPYAGRLVTRQDSLWKRALDNAARPPSNPHSSSDSARMDQATSR